MIIDRVVENMNRIITPDDDMYRGKDDHFAVCDILNRNEGIV